MFMLQIRHSLTPFHGRGTVSFARFSCSLADHTLQSRTGTKDLQHVDLKLRVLFRPMEHQLPHIHATYGSDPLIQASNHLLPFILIHIGYFLFLGTRFEQSILPSIVQETLKSVVARYNAEQLLTMREKVRPVARTVVVFRLTAPPCLPRFPSR
jgi:regulator of protease activity HflC (stomatin/prohibitin superfamily)